MNVKKYRAKTMQEALALVRRDLGPKAAVLHTREVRSSGLLRWLGGKSIEVLASTHVAVPSRLPPRQSLETPRRIQPRDESEVVAGREEIDSKLLEPDARRQNAPLHNKLQFRLDELQTQVEALCRRAEKRPEMSPALFGLFTDLIEADMNEELARELVESVREATPPRELEDPAELKNRLANLIEARLTVGGPIQITPGERRLVALVGPTGVGKTTTIAKLAASFRLREKRRVGLITVDTYRIAAVEQLRTYADIIDLPMEIVATPREMHQAVARMADLDLILMDTAGRSPRDDVRIQELKSMLAEAEPNEVHLVLSCVASANTLVKTAAQFATVGTTSLLLTKLDEATSLGNLLPLARSSRLPLSYLTHGQNVPDDIMAADACRLARTMLGLEDGAGR